NHQTGARSKDMTPISDRAGRIGLTAAALIISSALLRLNLGLVSGPNSAITLSHTLTYALAAASMYALLLAVTVFYVGARQALGALGLVGYLTVSLGTVLVAGDCWFEAFAVPTIGAHAPDVLALRPAGSVLAGAMIGGALFASGWITFAVAVFRSGAFSRPAAVLVIIGGGCGALALSTPYQVPLAIGIGWAGYTLLRAAAHRPASARTEQPVSFVAGGLPVRHPR
ncbi:MAG: hypothetical protein WCG47_18070, partial [Dermatophilaceae bacterium]